MKTSASQNNCEAKVCESNGGNPRPWSLTGTSTVPAGSGLSWAMAVSISRGGLLPHTHSMLGSAEGKQQKQRDQQREDAKRLGDGEAENQVSELSGRGRWVPDRRGQIVAEDDADADAGAAHADAGNPSTNVFRGRRVHEKAPVRGCLKDRYSMASMNRIVKVDASQNGEDVGLQQSHQQLERRE